MTFRPPFFIAGCSRMPALPVSGRFDGQGALT
jgi:hypothetical protein